MIALMNDIHRNVSLYKSPRRAHLYGMHSITEQAWNPVHYDRAGAFVPKLATDLIELLAPRPGERRRCAALSRGRTFVSLRQACSTHRGARVMRGSRFR